MLYLYVVGQANSVCSLKVIQLQCSDADGDQVFAEIVNTTSVGTLYQTTYNSQLKEYILGQPITTYNTMDGSVPVLNPANVVAFVPPSNQGGTTSFIYRCYDTSQVRESVTSPVLFNQVNSCFTLRLYQHRPT